MSISETLPPDSALPPRFAEALCLLEDHRIDEALIVCEQILSKQPDSPEAIMLLGLISYEFDEPLQAIELLTRAYEAAPHIRDFAEVLAAIQARLGNTAEALFQVKFATTLDPHPSGVSLVPPRFANFFESIESESPDKFRRRAERQFQKGDIAGAEQAAERQLELTPGDPATLRLLARIWRSTGRKTAAIAALHAVLHSAPTNADRSTLAALLSEAGRHDEAARVDTLAVYAAPDDSEVARSRLVNLAHNPDIGDNTLAASLAAWRNRHDDRKRAGSPMPSRPAVHTGERFRVALLGNRFDDPAAVHRLAPVVAALAGKGVAVHVYADVDRETIVSDRIRRHTSRWTSLKGVDPETAAAILRGDGIDVAIDLIGYGPGSRLSTYGWKPARLCLGWSGSALPVADGFDWLLTGPEGWPGDLAPPAATPLWRLPRTPLVYPEPAGLDSPSELPALVNGMPTLGTAMPLGAIGGATLALWADLLGAVSNARLLVANIDRLDDACVARAHEQISHAGLRERVDIVDLDEGPFVDLEFWRHVDIAVDPQPVGSFSRTAQALWSGVPAIALRGDRFAGRGGAAALSAAGRADWIVDDNAGAAALLCSLLRDAGELAALRSSLPAMIAAAPLADADGLADDLIAAFAEMLRTI